MATHSYLGVINYDVGGGVYTGAFGNIVSFDPPKLAVGEVKNSGLGNAAATHTFQAGWITPGECKVEINMLAADYNTLLGFLSGRANKNWRITYADGTSTPATTTGSKLVFNAFLKELGDKQLSIDSDAPVKTEFTLKVSGLPTFTPAT